MEMAALEQLLHDGMSLARHRISSDGRLNPFALLLEQGGGRQVIESLAAGDEGVEGLVYSAQSIVSANAVDAVLVCAQCKVTPDDENLKMDAISVLLETPDQCIKGYQLYGDNLEGQLMFAQLEMDESEPVVFTAGSNGQS
ncbi:hypothetical protein O5O45_29820 [Hahella aquimaris]|uniref:hypothetical protein n=1 Tax=Hahella sp. HNIBRBA332 TaxID=3015983 RepID=UPI00273C9687|nr:hypothetical protein [Hahella sp. HNIBRBA332]WLQ13926.1 hypothetical protein O5O45_29820 [Hahella sp. HNIBRBA332]